jgi:two-component system chemotaxis response regulator CheY
VELVTPRLLVTDDDVALRQTLGSAFDRLGYATELAGDGVEGLQIIRQVQIHLVVLDVHMPRLTGLEMLAALHEDHPRLPCILMTGALDHTIRSAAESLRVFSVLEKPIRWAKLRQAVTAALKSTYGW